MLKTVALVALLCAAAAAKFVGTEFVSPEIKARSRRQQDEAETDQLTDAPVTASQQLRDEPEVAAPEALQNSNSPLVGVVVDAAGKTPELSEDQMTEVQMLLALRDIVRLEKYVPSLIGQLSQRIYGDLENTLLINRFTQSFQMYEMILGVLQKYRLNKPIIAAKANYLVGAVKTATAFIRKTNDKFIALIDPEDPPEVQAKNRMIFMRALELLTEEVEQLAEAILKDFDDFFQAMESTHRHPLKSDLQKIHLLIEAALNLVVFKKTTLNDRATKVLELRRQVLENPAYNSHLKKIQDDRIVLAGVARPVALLALTISFFCSKL